MEEKITARVTAEVTDKVTANQKKLYRFLRDADRMDDYDRAMEDDAYMAELQKELDLQ